ncbi:hypothetical protein CDAR_384211 [Caerostris darwini]|uniref:Uncharacterized protein n=1 Tax=Caerostris darwini TaxID=1538125 RepID=A0AAV4QVE6_9ARAC|nr:hypothetical protein CDAR_384211 [Caerostris darwini]
MAKAVTMKLQDAYNDYFQCLLELSGSRKVALESITNSLEPRWRYFPELQAESGNAVSNVEDFCNKLLTHLGNNAEEADSCCEEDIAKRESLFDEIAKTKQKIALATTDQDTNKELIDSRKRQLAFLQNNVFKKTFELKNKLADINIREKETFRKFFQVWFAEEEKFHKRDSEILCNIEILLASLPKKEESAELIPNEEM